MTNFPRQPHQSTDWLWLRSWLQRLCFFELLAWCLFTFYLCPFFPCPFFPFCRAFLAFPQPHPAGCLLPQLLILRPGLVLILPAVALHSPLPARNHNAPAGFERVNPGLALWFHLGESHS